MNSHQNAKTNLRIRALIANRVLEQNPPSGRVAEERGISLRTIYK